VPLTIAHGTVRVGCLVYLQLYTESLVRDRAAHTGTPTNCIMKRDKVMKRALFAAVPVKKTLVVCHVVCHVACPGDMIKI
jgi:hypothetical protein